MTNQSFSATRVPDLALVNSLQALVPTFQYRGESTEYLSERIRLAGGTAPPVPPATRLDGGTARELALPSGPGRIEGDRRFDAAPESSAREDQIDPEQSRQDMHDRNASAWQRPAAAERRDATPPSDLDESEKARLAMRELNENAWRGARR